MSLMLEGTVQNYPDFSLHGSRQTAGKQLKRRGLAAVLELESTSSTCQYVNAHSHSSKESWSAHLTEHHASQDQ